MFASSNPLQQKPRKEGPNSQNKGQSKESQPQGNQPKLQAKKGNEKSKKDTRRWCEFHRSPWHNTDEFCLKQILFARLKEKKIDFGSYYNSEKK